MFKLIEETEISDLAVNFLKEMYSLGREISYGNKEHSYLTCSRNVPDDFEKGRKECLDLSLVEYPKVADGYYFKIRITDRGMKVLGLNI